MIGILQNYCWHISGDGKLEAVKLSSTLKNVTDNVEGENSFWENYTTNTITGVAVYDTSENLVQVVGTDTNVYKIVGNIFLLNQTAENITTICTNILNQLDDIQYVPTELSLIESDLTYKLGDYLQTDSGNTYIFKNSLSGSLFVNQRTTATANGANLSDDVEGVNESLIEGQKISRIEKNIDGIEAEIADMGTAMSTLISITAGKVVLKATSGTSVTEVTIGSLNTVGQQSVFQVSAQNIDITANEAINFLSGGDINLQGKNITLSTTNGNFGVTSAGALTCKTGNIGGWDITSTSIGKEITVTESGNSVKYRPYLNAPS
jgi:chaperonin cofactor prefoldin